MEIKSWIKLYLLYKHVDVAHISSRLEGNLI